MTARPTPAGFGDIATQWPTQVESFRSHRGEEDDVANICDTRQIHEQSIDSYPYTAHRRHAVFHRAQVVLVDAACLVVAGGLGACLRLKPPALIDGIVQLAESIRHFAPLCKQFEPFRNAGWPATLRLREGRKFDGIIED